MGSKRKRKVKATEAAIKRNNSELHRQRSCRLKQYYESYYDALRASKSIDPLAMAVYPCEYCDGYHLSST